MMTQMCRLTKESPKSRTEIIEEEKELFEKEKIRFQEEEKSFAKKVQEFHEKQKKILGCLEKNAQEQSSRVEKIVAIISHMRPQKASEVLQVQDEDIAVTVLSKLEDKKASKIFNVMEKEKSARLQKLYMNMKK